MGKIVQSEAIKDLILFSVIFGQRTDVAPLYCPWTCLLSTYKNNNMFTVVMNCSF